MGDPGTPSRTVVVAGDVCIDWVSIPVDPLAPLDGEKADNWQLVAGRHMHALRGGAWLTADLVQQAVGKEAVVHGPQAMEHLAAVPPDELVHSMLMLSRSKRMRGKDEVRVWTVKGFEGFAGPMPEASEKKKTPPVERDDATARLVVLDDAGNGFRDVKRAFPLALLEKTDQVLVLHKVRRPLCRGELWKRIEGFHLPRTVALLTADELRSEGADVTRGLSWERTATDLVLALDREPKFVQLRNCPFLVVSLGIEGAVLVRHQDGRVASARLWYVPNLTEGELRQRGRRDGSGDMSGFGSVMAAAVAAALVPVTDKLSPRAGPPVADLEAGLRKGITDGLHAMHRLLDLGFGPCEELKGGKTVRRAPAIPLEDTFAPLDPKRALVVHEVEMPKPPAAGSGPQPTTDFRAWRLLDSVRTRPILDLAVETVRRGHAKVLGTVPVARFGELVTVEKKEIETFRALRSLIREFLDNPRPARPLCIGVFGRPGAGKSYGVNQVARDVAGAGVVEKIEFNVSQWTDPSLLVQALHQVRDDALRGKTPLVFFDEFDCVYEGRPLGWLKYFLAPMQDGVFADGLAKHQVGKAILVFAGGTANSFEEFRKKAGRSENAEADEGKDEDRRRSLKVPDFLSRLRGYVDVFGVDPPGNTNVLRRALVLRSHLTKEHLKLQDSSGAVRIDEGVLRAFLQTNFLQHGVRSIEAIVEMSRLVDRSHFEPSLLPSETQLDLHAKGSEFLGLVRHLQALGGKLEPLAQEVHKRFQEEEAKTAAAKGGTPKPPPPDWNGLSDLLRNSNREHAAYYPTLLAAAGCGFVEDSKLPVIPFPPVPDDVDRLAKMEHERWFEERRIRQPDHPSLVPWEDLDEETKDKDRRAVRAIPEMLAKVGLRVVRYE